MNFLVGHECMFGPYCLFAHTVSEVEEKVQDTDSKKMVALPHGQKRLFYNMGVWPSICIITYFTQEEIIETIRRINKQALALCKRTYAPKRVQLHKINLGTVKFFERTEEIKITNDSLGFFQQFEENFFKEILAHYKNLNRLTISLNFLFEEERKNKFLELLCGMHQTVPL